MYVLYVGAMYSELFKGYASGTMGLPTTFVRSFFNFSIAPNYSKLEPELYVRQLHVLDVCSLRCMQFRATYSFLVFNAPC